MLKPLRHALRQWRQTPGFTLVCVCSLAIGIGATSAMFSFGDALLLRPLPVYEPSRVASVTMASTELFSNGGLSYPDYRDYRDNNHTFDGLFAASFSSFGLKQDPAGLPRVTLGLFVSGNFFQVLGVRPMLGRAFMPSEDTAVGRDAVVVLGHDYWKNEFNGDQAIVGSKIWINGTPFTVIGIAPAEFTGIDAFVKPSLFVPLAMSPRLNGENDLERRDVRWLTVKGRLKAGAGVAQATADIAAISGRLERMYPQSNKNQRAQVESEFTLRVRQSPPNAALVVMLLLLSFCVLAVACANVAGLLLSRARARNREMAVRLAIGASRAGLIRQLLAENLLLSLTGGALGVAVAYIGVSFLNGIPIPVDIPLAYHVSIDQRMLLFTVAVAVASTFLFGFTPALQTTRLNLVTSLKSADADSAGRRRLWGRNLIVAGQVALSLVLLIISAVLLQGFRGELMQGPGFRTDGLWLTTFDTGPIHYTEAQTRQFYRDVLEKMRLAPGVRSAALASGLPLLGGGATALVPEGYTLPRGQESITVPNFVVSEGYFSTAGIPIVRGRGFLTSDRADTPLVAVVNQQFATHYWPHEDAIGKRFHLKSAAGTPVEIVGIAKMAKYFWIAEPPQDFIYLPYTQDKITPMTIMAQSAGPDAGALAGVLRHVVESIDRSVPLSNARTIRDFYTQRAVKTPNMISQSVAGLGAMGLILAIIGLYGLLAYSVSRRRREIGIRMAIGASRSRTILMILRQGLTLASIGVAAGLAISYFACRAIISFAWVATFDHLDYALFPAIAIPLLAITALATLLPARRASLVNPMRALREE